jgi:hypothetical protein
MIKDELINQSQNDNASLLRDLAATEEIQKELAISKRFVAKLIKQVDLDTLPDASNKLVDLHQSLLKELKSQGLDARQAENRLELLFDKLLQGKDNLQISSIVNSICSLAREDRVSSIDFKGIGSAIALDVLVELSDPLSQVHQGMSNACSVTARRYIAEKPDVYAEFVADIVADGFGFIGRSDTGAKQGVFNYEEGMFSKKELLNRTLGSAIYQSVVLDFLGSADEGLMPADIERFLEARGQPAKLLTFNSDLIDVPLSEGAVIEQIKLAAKQGRTGLISLEFASDGAHSKHILELCPQAGVPSGYIRLSNPWSLKDSLPERYRDMVKDLGDGTFLIKENDLKANLYFAVLETKDPNDFGKTSGVVEGTYQKDMIPQHLLSFFGFSERKQEKSTLSFLNGSVVAVAKKSENIEAEQKPKNKEAEEQKISAREGEKYFRELQRNKQ